MTYRCQYVSIIFRGAVVNKILRRSLMHQVYKSETMVQGCPQVSPYSPKGLSVKA